MAAGHGDTRQRLLQQPGCLRLFENDSWEIIVRLVCLPCATEYASTRIRLVAARHDCDTGPESVLTDCVGEVTRVQRRPGCRQHPEACFAECRNHSH